MTVVQKSKTGPQPYRVVIEESAGRWAWRIENSARVVLCRGGTDYKMWKSAVEAAENCVMTIRGAKVYRAGYRDGRPDYRINGSTI